MVGRPPAVRPPPVAAGADQDLADGVIPDAVEDGDGFGVGAPGVDGARHDGLDLSVVNAGWRWVIFIATGLLGPSIVASVGFGLCLAPVVSVATAGVEPSETGTASGLLNSSRQIGASLGQGPSSARSLNTAPARSPHRKP